MGYFIDASSGSLQKEMRDRYKESQPLFQQWWYEANIDTKMTIGQQDYWNQIYSVNYRNQRTLQFNKILRLVNMISGYQRKNRHIILCEPVENSDNETADQLTALMYHVANNIELYETISETFMSALITGFNLLSVWMDYRDDPENGDIKVSRLPYNAFIMDSYWKEPDLSDCDWVWVRRYLSQEQAISLVPEYQGREIKKIKPTQNQSADGRFLYMPENRQMYNQDFYSYDEYWTREYRTVKKIVDKRSGEVVNVPDQWDDDRLNLFLYSTPTADVIKVRQPTCKLHVLVNDNLVWEEMRPYGSDKLPFVPYMCYHFPEAEDYSYRYMGVVRNSRDSQIELNRRRNKLFDILDSQMNSGIIVKEDALVDPEDAFLTGQGRVLFLKETASVADVREVQPPQIPPSMFELVKMLEDDIMNQAGATEELFGEDEKSNSGYMLKLRMGAGLVSYQGVFDYLRRSQKLTGELVMEYQQANWKPGKVARILNKEPTQQFKDMSFQKYDCVVTEGLLTSTQQQLEYIQLLQLRESGVYVSPKRLLETATVQNKNDLIEDAEQFEQQQAQAAEEKRQADMYQQALVTRSIEAKAQNDFAAAQERQGRTISNIGLYAERESEKAQNMASAALDQVRAIKELRDMDDGRLMKLAEFVMRLQTAMKVQSDDVEPKGIMTADFVGKDVDVAKKETELPQEKPSSVSDEIQKDASPV